MLELNHVQELLTDSEFESRLQLPASLSDFLEKRGPLPTVAHDLRRFPRFYYPSSALLDLGQTLPAFPRNLGRSVILTKDLSRTGVALLHTDQLYPGELLKLILPCGEKQLIVVRCQLRADECYEAAGFFV